MTDAPAPPPPSPSSSTDTPSASDQPAWRDQPRKRIKVALASTAAIVLARMIGMTLRMDNDDLYAPERQDIYDKYGSALFAVWHGINFPVLWGYRHKNIHIIMSQSADGEILARLAQHLGCQTIRGSSTRGGKRALIEIARKVRAGALATIAVDGPKGPRHEVKPGIITLSHLTGCPIIPAGSAMSHYYTFQSWDRFQLPYPFSRVVTRIGDPWFPPRDREAAAKELKLRIDAMQEEAETAVASD